jgi:hypothetical protein
MPDELRVEPPPRLELQPELPPVLIPRLRELPPYPGPVPDEIEPFASEPVRDPLAERLDEIRERAFAHERLRRLRGGRFTEIGAALRGKREADEPLTVLHVVWDHEARVSIETTLDAETLEVVDVVESTEQPAPTQDEIDRAVAIATADERLAREAGERSGLVGMALLVSPVDPQDPLFGHRVLDVRFVYPEERLPRASAVVDLTDEVVVRVGDPCSHQRDRGEEP